MLNRVIYVLIFAVLLIGGSTYVLQEAEGAINKIVGYVSEAKKRALAEANQTATTNQTAGETYVPPKEDTTNRSDDIVTTAVKQFNRALGLAEPEEEEVKRFVKIIGVQLSRTCLQQEKYNLTKNCPTYSDLMHVDNTLPEISGNVTYSEGYWHREQSRYKDHCNWYLDKYPILIIVDPDGCWQRETGIRMITIQSISPEKMIYKLKADRAVVQDLRELQEDEREAVIDKDEAEKEIDSLEDQIDDLEDRVRDLEDDIKLNEADKDKSSLSTRNLKFQLRFAVDNLRDKEIDLVAEEIEFEKYRKHLNATRFDRKVIQQTFSSTLMFEGKSAMGIGRYVEECRNATIGSSMDLFMDTLNYIIRDCDQEATNFDSIKTTTIKQTPLLISDFTDYKYKQWLKEAKERCKQKC